MDKDHECTGKGGPLLVVMRALVEAGLTAGVNLRSDGDKIKFGHRWVLITAKKVS
jgi:hypothetical protein